MKRSAVLLFCFAVLNVSRFAFGQAWTLTTAPSKNWFCVACSADGTRIIAAAHGATSPYWGPIYTSPDSGATWVSNNVPQQPWASVASSADGNILLAALTDGRIYISKNAGATWAMTGSPIRAWASVAASPDGTKLIAIAPAAYPYNEEVSTSVDSGMTWTSNFLAGVIGPHGASSSADGTRLAVVAERGAVYTTADSGQTWTSNFINSPFTDMPCITGSADEKVLATGPAGNGGRLYTSTNSGAAWNSYPAQQVWQQLACSADGSKLIAGGWPAIYTSTNFGATWISNTAPALTWHGVASSADGNKLVAVASPGGIYTWQATPSPHLEISVADTNLRLSWIVPSTNFVLEHSFSFAPSHWEPVTNSPVINLTNLHEEVILRAAALDFFRLAGP
jgi:photosystem II stability/assembly factor-like uncharacterized protein